MILTTPGRPLRGRVRVPGDKSVSHRALILNALAEGEARVEGLLDAEDVASTARCLRALGVQVEPGRVVGSAWREPEEILDCGNSGTTMRLLSGALAGWPLQAVLTGDETLRRRPMERVLGPLRAMGAFTSARAGGLPPLVIRGGALRAGPVRTAVASAQVKSALILASLRAEGTLELEEPAATRDHTERMLRAMGVTIEQEGRFLRMEGGQRPRAVDVVVPGDISSAAFFLVAAAITPGSDLVVEGVGVNPGRTGVLDVLEAMGASVERLAEREVGGEPVADLRVRHGELRGVEIAGALIPRLVDEIPVLAVAAAFARGRTVVADAAELRVKESDRVAATVAGLRACGVLAEERPDGLVVEGGAPGGGEVDDRGDHRIAMAFSVLGCAGSGPVCVRDGRNVATSFPAFVSTLESARA